jgi:hypothetical protein
MTEKSLAPMTTIDQVLRIDSAQYPSGNGPAVCLWSAIENAHSDSTIHPLSTEFF